MGHRAGDAAGEGREAAGQMWDTHSVEKSILRTWAAGRRGPQGALGPRGAPSTAFLPFALPAGPRPPSPMKIARVACGARPALQPLPGPRGRITRRASGASLCRGLLFTRPTAAHPPWRCLFPQLCLPPHPEWLPEAPVPRRRCGRASFKPRARRTAALWAAHSRPASLGPHAMRSADGSTSRAPPLSASGMWVVCYDVPPGLTHPDPGGPGLSNGGTRSRSPVAGADTSDAGGAGRAGKDPESR